MQRRGARLLACRQQGASRLWLTEGVGQPSVIALHPLQALSFTSPCSTLLAPHKARSCWWSPTCALWALVAPAAPCYTSRAKGLSPGRTARSSPAQGEVLAAAPWLHNRNAVLLPLGFFSFLLFFWIILISLIIL